MAIGYEYFDTLANNQGIHFGGVAYSALPQADVPPSGSQGGRDYWEFGTAKIFGLKVANVGYGDYYVGYSGSTPWSASPGLEPNAAVTDVQMIPYIQPAPFLFGVDDALGEIPFEGTAGGGGGVGGGTLHTTSGSTSTPLAAVSDVGGSRISPWLIVAAIVAVILLFGKDRT